MSQYFLEHKFDVIYILGNSLAHAKTQNLKKIFKNIYSGLNPNSYFIFDIREWVKTKSGTLRQSSRETDTKTYIGKIDVNNKSLKLSEIVSYIGNIQKVKYFISSQDDDLIDTFTLQYSMFNLSDIKNDLYQSGFKEQDITIVPTKNWSYKVIKCKK